MIHPTYRSLDAPVKLLGLSWRQWLCLVAGGVALIALVHLAGIPTRPAISFCAIAIGVPLALAYLSEETGFGFGRLVMDMVRWRFEQHVLSEGASERTTGLVVAPDPAATAAVARRTEAVDW